MCTCNTKASLSLLLDSFHVFLYLWPLYHRSVCDRRSDYNQVWWPSVYMMIPNEFLVQKYTQMFDLTWEIYYISLLHHQRVKLKLLFSCDWCIIAIILKPISSFLRSLTIKSAHSRRNRCLSLRVSHHYWYCYGFFPQVYFIFQFPIKDSVPFSYTIHSM